MYFFDYLLYFKSQIYLYKKYCIIILIIIKFIVEKIIDQELNKCEHNKLPTKLWIFVSWDVDSSGMKILEGTYRLVSVKHTQVLGCISITTETRTQFQVRRSISRIDSNDRHGCLLGLGVYGYAVSRVRRHVTIHYIRTYEFI